MTTGYRVREARMLRIYCPVERQTIIALAGGDASAMERDPTLAKMLRILRADGPLGDFGIYKSVAEIVAGWEIFRPETGAQPAFGEPGQPAASPTVILTTYFPYDASAHAVDRCLEAIMLAHPWETPVIELRDASLLERS